MKLYHHAQKESFYTEERVSGIELPSLICPTKIKILIFISFARIPLYLERETGIEPAYTAWKAVALPLCYSRKYFFIFSIVLIKLVGEPGFEPGLNAPKALVLPLHYSPEITIIKARTNYRIC